MPVSGFGLPSQRVDWVNTVNRAPWAHTSASQGRPRGATSDAGDGAAATAKETAAPRRSWPEPRYRGPPDLRLGPKGAARRCAHDGDDDRRRGRPEHRRWRAEATAAFRSASREAYEAPNWPRLVAFERGVSGAAGGGGGFAGIGRNQHWRRAEAAAFSGARRDRCLGGTGRRVRVHVGLLGTPGAQL